jgi:transcriptional regulator with XRE-family HTH domain
MSYGKRLGEALTFAKKERKELADALEVSVQAIGQVLIGKTAALTAENSARAARFLKVSHFWLATGEGEMMDHENPPKKAANDAEQFSLYGRSLARLYDSLPTDDPNALMLVLHKATVPIVEYQSLRQGHLPTQSPQSSQETPAAAPPLPTTQRK